MACCAHISSPSSTGTSIFSNSAAGSPSTTRALTRTFAFYESFADAAEEESLRSIDAQAMALLLSQPAMARSPARLLDAGCGAGVELTAFLRHGLDARGVDASSALVEKAAKKGLPVACGDLRLSSLERESLDAVWCKRVLPHFPRLEDFQRVLISFLHALKPGTGQLYLTAFTGSGSFEDRSLAGDVGGGADSPARTWFAYEEKALLSLLRQSGFTPILRADRQIGLPVVAQARPEWRELALLLHRA